MGWYVDEDPDAFHKSVPNEIATLSTVTPADNDVLLIEDASDGYTKKKVLAGSLGGDGGGGGGGSELLALVQYDPETETAYEISSSTLTALDTTNLRAVFTAP